MVVGDVLPVSCVVLRPFDDVRELEDDAQDEQAGHKHAGEQHPTVLVTMAALASFERLRSSK